MSREITIVHSKYIIVNILYADILVAKNMQLNI